MINKLKKIDFKLLGIITVVVTILCNAFLQMHYSSDTFVLMDLGYMNYPQKYFLLDGRIISAAVCFLAGILHIPYNAYIISMDVIAVFFVCISIYVTYITIYNIIQPKTISKKCLCLMASFVLILNQFSLEYLLFPESAVMCLGQMLCVISASLVLSNNKHKYLKIGLMLFIAVFCYQGVLNIFPALALLFIFLNQIKNKSSIKDNIKEIFKKLLIPAIICILAIIINVIAVKIGCKLLNDSSYRQIKLLDFESVLLRLKTIGIYLDKIWNQSLEMLPKYTNWIILIITLILLSLNNLRLKTIPKYLFLLVVIFISCIVPMFFLNTGPCGRVNIPISQIIGISLLFIIATLENLNTKKYLKHISYIFIICTFILNSIMILRNSNEHIAANKVDENMGRSIKYILEKYESDTGNKITKFSYVYDPDPQQYAPGIKHIGSLTERKLACSWCISQAMNYYCDRKMEKVRMPIKIYIEKIKRKNYTEFSEEQVIFDNDTMYLYVF